MFKKLLLTFVALITSLSVFAADVDTKDPYKMLSVVAQDTFDTIKAHKDQVKTDLAFRKDLIRTKLMPYVDSTYAAYRVIGNNLKQTTKEQRDAFADAFSEYIIASYAEALGKYDNQELVIPPYQKVGADENMVNIKFLIREAGKQDLELIFKLRKNSKTGEWKAFDMVAENISMLSAKQSELSPLIRQKGIDAVTKMIADHNASGSAEPLVPETK